MPINKNIPTEFPEGDLSVILPGAVGTLEALTSAPNNASDVVVVICHPHSLHGGTMHNKVVYTLARAFKEMNLRTVRFNFRGVGASEGNYDEGIGETEDLLTVLKWVQQVRPQDKIWLTGFSFGSYVAARAAKTWPAQQLISIAPPVENFPFKQLPPFTCPWLVVQGEADEVVAPQKVFSWLAELPQPPQLIRMPDTSHFFHGKLVELRQLLITALSPQLKK